MVDFADLVAIESRGLIAATTAIVVVSLLGRAPSEQVRITHQDVRDTLKTYGY